MSSKKQEPEKANWSSSKITTLFISYLNNKDFEVVFTDFAPINGLNVDKLLNIISRGISYGDALVTITAEQVDMELFVTWNKKHFDKNIEAEVRTPENFQFNEMDKKG